MKINANSFNQFKEYCLRYINKLDLKDWNVKIITKNSKSLGGITQTGSKSATIYLSSDSWETLPNSTLLSKIAKHEVSHLLLMDLINACKTRFLDEEEFKKVVETITKKITNLL
jgi:hypothetical protein